MKLVNRSVLVLKPTDKMLDWLKLAARPRKGLGVYSSTGGLGDFSFTL
jgi:hypothetical protein